MCERERGDERGVRKGMYMYELVCEGECIGSFSACMFIE